MIKPMLIVEVQNNEYIICPYCNDVHYHGKPDGHRIAHCSQRLVSRLVYKDGHTYTHDDGYYIQHKKEDQQ